MKILTTILILLGFCFSAHSQDVIELNNPSFEDTPQPSKAPRGWRTCGSPGESPPDIQPNSTFKVVKEAFHGNTYLGMVTRDNGTSEAVGQKLSEPLIEGQTYYLSMHLATSEYYFSISRRTQLKASFTTPVVLKIWAVNKLYEKLQLLDETNPIRHAEWKAYLFELHPKEEVNYIVLEAYYGTPGSEPYNGNVLVDNCSAIVTDSASIMKANVDYKRDDLIKHDVVLVKKTLNVEDAQYYVKYRLKPELVTNSSSYIGLLKSVKYFKTYTERNGLRKYFKKHPLEALIGTQNSLEQLGAPNTFEKYKEYLLLFTKSQKRNSLTKEEKRALKNCGAPFKTATENEIYKAMEAYVEKYSAEIISEMGKK